MPETEVVYFMDKGGKVPVKKWLSTLPEDVQLKVVGVVTRLRDLGHELRRPECDYLSDKIYELRASLHHINYRILYFFHQKRIVLSHGLIKENIVPPQEIDRAIANRLLYEHDPDKYTYKEAGLWV